MRQFLITTLLGCILFTFNSHSQNEVKPYTFMIGLSWNAIEDDGEPYKNLGNITSSWNMIAAPTSLSVDYYLAKGMSIEALFNLNRYKNTNIVNGRTGVEGIIFNSDLNFKYSFGSLMRQPYFDPFIFIGASYTMRPIQNLQMMVSPNIGLGFNVMFTEYLGIQLRSAAKIAVYPVFYRHKANYLHYHAGIIYKFGAIDYSGHFNGKRHKWTNKRYKIKSPRGLQ